MNGGTLGSMPWVPELFSAPVLQRVLDQRRRDALVAMPYFDGLLAGNRAAQHPLPYETWEEGVGMQSLAEQRCRGAR